MNPRALLLWLVGLGLAGCPGNITHYAATMTPLAVCEITQGQSHCEASPDGGLSIQGSLSVDERGEHTRVFFREDTLLGTTDGDRILVDSYRDQVREQSGCRTRQALKLEALQDNPGLGLRQELRGSFEERQTTEGDPQQCGRNVPYGTLTHYRLTAMEVSAP